MKKLLFILIPLFIIFYSNSCSKKKGCTDILSINYDQEAEKDDGTCVYGGEGGQNSIILYPKSQGRSVVSKPSYLDSAYVKFNAIEAPGGPEPPGGNPQLYDKIYTGNIGDTTIKITGLKRGKYFIYVAGVDSLLTFSTKRVAKGYLIIIDKDGEINKVVYLGPICCVF